RKIYKTIAWHNKCFITQYAYWCIKRI
ncbi:ribosomal L6 family protein, partial [Chlamydia psittaci 02DC14]